jgi:hypothetical protein
MISPPPGELQDAEMHDGPLLPPPGESDNADIPQSHYQCCLEILLMRIDIKNL